MGKRGIKLASYVLIPAVALSVSGCSYFRQDINNAFNEFKQEAKNVCEISLETSKMLYDWAFDNSIKKNPDAYYIDLHNHFDPEKSLSDLENNIEVLMENVDIVGIIGRPANSEEYVSDYSKIVDELSKSEKFEVKITGNLTEVKINSDSLYLVKGQEITTLEGFDVVAISCNEDFYPNIHLDELLEKINQNKGISIIAHPFTLTNDSFEYSLLSYEKSDKLADLKDSYDAVEKFNSHNILWMVKSNINSRKLCNEYGISGISSSDSHKNINIMGLSGILVDKKYIKTENEELFVNSLRDAIKGRNFEIHKEYASPVSFFNDIASKVFIAKYLQRIGK